MSVLKIECGTLSAEPSFLYRTFYKSTDFEFVGGLLVGICYAPWQFCQGLGNTITVEMGHIEKGTSQERT
ncbi:MAG: hypothetical protein B1H40_03365 [Candidatus Latescibacteria bacterium 4484_181]|nr:MAG: hypothetical protein B1H40_03365 [Candidatus Latescibacteria bacterium 4484_181]RKY68115.1 MAG: hypothetical protein DRQ02_05225 [Candidatus Latescibacterota bacterium]RKY71356.1 MAG: hypothetical protein DRQ24_07565 [Candidatus Latescibacterota bacterium]